VVRKSYVEMLYRSGAQTHTESWVDPSLSVEGLLLFISRVTSPASEIPLG